MDEAIAILRRYALGVWRRRWIALGTAWLICLVGWFGVMSLPSIYEADAEIEMGPTSALAPYLPGRAVGDSANSDVVVLLQRILLSRPILASLIAKENLLDGRDTPDARATLERKLATTIQIVPDTDRIQGQDLGSFLSIAYRDRDPDRAYAVVKGMLSIFVDQTVGSNRTDLANAQRFLDSQIASYSRQLQDVQQQRAAFVAKYSELLPGQNDAPSQFDLVRSNVRSLETRWQNAQAQIALLQRELATTPETVTVGPDTANSQALATAEQHLASLRQRFTDAYPGVIEARKLVADLASGKGLAAVPGQAVPNPVYDKLKLQIIDAQTSEIAVQRELEAATAERNQMAVLANSNPNVRAEYLNLNRQYDLVRKQYDDLLSRRASTQITAAASKNADPIRLNVVNPPQRPLIPVAPRRKLFLAGVLVAGLGAGAALAFALAYADSCCYTVRELEDIGLPVIGGISLRKAPSRGRQTLPAFAFGAGVCLLVVAFVGVVAVAGQFGWHS